MCIFYSLCWWGRQAIFLEPHNVYFYILVVQWHVVSFGVLEDKYSLSTPLPSILSCFINIGTGYVVNHTVHLLHTTSLFAQLHLFAFIVDTQLGAVVYDVEYFFLVGYIGVGFDHFAQAFPVDTYCLFYYYMKSFCWITSVYACRVITQSPSKKRIMPKSYIKNVYNIHNHVKFFCYFVCVL